MPVPVKLIVTEVPGHMSSAASLVKAILPSYEIFLLLKEMNCCENPLRLKKIKRTTVNNFLIIDN
jgi:hypothetical protein